MKKKIYLILSLVAGMALQPTSAENPPEGFQALFNGKDLQGWHGLDPHEAVELKGRARQAALEQMKADFSKHWRVDNGELINAGSGPHACTDQEFGNLELMLEYKVRTGVDSGVYLRGTPEVQILSRHSRYDPARTGFIPGFGPGGLVHNPPQTLGRHPLMAMDTMPHNWQKMRILQIGARTWVYVNHDRKPVVDGTVMANYWNREKPLPASGPVLLAAAEGGEIRFRNIYARAVGQEEAEAFLAENPPIPEPDFCDVPYGSHPKQVFHLWLAESDKPTPLIVLYHSGGWWGGGRFHRGELDMIQSFLDAGISYASVAYRFTHEADDAGLVPRMKGPLYDARRGLQYLRHNAETYNVDPDRIALSGGSAGGYSALWLGLRSDMADPASADPVLRESTRVSCIGVHLAQTSCDPEQVKAWLPNTQGCLNSLNIVGDKKTGLSAYDEYLQNREGFRPTIEEFSPAANVSKDDPPVFMSYGHPPKMGQADPQGAHSANYGQGLYEVCIERGLECHLVYRGSKLSGYETMLDFFKDKLK